MHPIEWATFDELTSGDLYSILELRATVFVVEQECAFQDLDRRDLDSGAVHAWIRSGACVVACFHVYPYEGAMKVSRVATALGARGQGLASLLVRSAVARFGADDLVLDAQSRLVEWYASFGFVTDGDDFLEDGILHTPMRRQGSA